MSAKLSILSLPHIGNDTKEKVLKYLKLADSAHDFKGQRSETSLTMEEPFKKLNKGLPTIAPSTIEHQAQITILALADNITEKNNLSKLINNNEYNFEITINNELDNITDTASITNIYKPANDVIKELKLNVQFDRILHGTKLKNKKFFSKSVLDYFITKYNQIYGINNKEYLIDAVNIPISYFLSSDRNTDTYKQLVEESNKWDMAPTSAPDDFKVGCENLNFENRKTVWNITKSESIVTQLDGGVSTIWNNIDIQNISTVTISINSATFKNFNNSFCDDTNYSYILLTQGQYTIKGDNIAKIIPILTTNLTCFTVKLIVDNKENNCYGYIVFINSDNNNICLLASNAYRKNQDASIGVPSLSIYLTSPHEDLNKVTQHLKCEAYTFILDIKRTGDWGQIIQVNNQYLINKRITLISLDYLAILFAKLINIPYIHTTVNEHFVSFTMRNAELVEKPSDEAVYTNLKNKIENLINKYNSFLDKDFFAKYTEIDRALKILFVEETYRLPNIINKVFIKNIFKFMYNVVNNVFLQHQNNINIFYQNITAYNEIITNKPIDYKSAHLKLIQIYNDIEKKYILIENIKDELEINTDNVKALDSLNGMSNEDPKASLSKLDSIKKKFLFNITIMKGNMNFAKSIVFLIDKLIDLNNINSTSIERIAIRNQKIKNEIIFNIYKQILNIINKINFYNGIEPIDEDFGLDYNTNIQKINTLLDKFQKNTDTIPKVKLIDSGNNVIMNGGNNEDILLNNNNLSAGAPFLRFLFNSDPEPKIIKIKNLQRDWKDKSTKAFKSNDFHHKKTQVKSPNIIHKLNFYYSTLNASPPIVSFNTTSLYGSITKLLCDELIDNKNKIVLCFMNTTPNSTRSNSTYILEYKIIVDTKGNTHKELGKLKSKNNLHILAKEFFLLFVEKIFIQRINKYLKSINEKETKYTSEPIQASYVKDINKGFIPKLNVQIVDKSVEGYDYMNYLYLDFIYLINLPLYENKFLPLKKKLQEKIYGNWDWIKYTLYYYYNKLIKNEDISIDKDEYITEISDIIINDETYEKLKNLNYNLGIITDHPTSDHLDIKDNNLYSQWHSHLLIFTDILEKIKENRVIIFGIQDGGGQSDTNNYICHENLRQVYISLKYLVSIHDDDIYTFEAQIFKNICHFFEIDIPEEPDITKRDNIKSIIRFINSIFVNRYLAIKQNIIENQIYTDWEKEDITNFFRYYDIYTTIKDYQNIVNEINELMMNDSYDLEYCVKQLWGSVESLDMYVEQYFKFKYNDKLILSHEGTIFNREVYISKITENTLLKDVDKLPKLPEKKKTVLWENIIKYIKNGRYNRDKLKTFIDYLNSYPEHSSKEEQQPIQAQPMNKIPSLILGYGGSDKTQPTIKKHSRKKK
jgi:hypothetical protein